MGSNLRKCDVKLKGNRDVEWIDAFIFGNSQKIWDGPKEEHPTYWEKEQVLFSVKGNPLYALQWTESTKPVQEPNLLE